MDDKRGQKRKASTGDSEETPAAKRSLLVTVLGRVGQLLLLPGTMLRWSFGRMIGDSGDNLSPQVEQLQPDERRPSRAPTIRVRDTEEHIRVTVCAANVYWWPTGLTVHREGHVLVISGQFTTPPVSAGACDTVQFRRNLLMPDSCEGGLIRMEAAHDGVDIFVSKVERNSEPGGYVDEPDQFRVFLDLNARRPNRLTVDRRGQSLVIRKRFVEERDGHRIKTRAESVLHLPPECAGNAMVPRWQYQQRRLMVTVPKTRPINAGPATSDNQQLSFDNLQKS